MSRVLRSARSFLMVTLLGGISFWLPVASIELLRKGQMSPIVGTILPFASQLFCYAAFARGRPMKRGLALSMLAGLYLLGPLFMEIGATAGQGGFSQFHGWRDAVYLSLCSIFPPATLMLATYHMTLLGVMLSSASMLILHFRYEKTHAPRIPVER